jgi:hypothetical protein
MVDIYEDRKELLSSIKRVKFLDELRDCLLVMKLVFIQLPPLLFAVCYATETSISRTKSNPLHSLFVCLATLMDIFKCSFLLLFSCLASVNAYS